MLTIAAIAVVAALIALLLFAATRPDTFSMSRSITVAVPQDQVFALINDLKSFNAWNPWAVKEPEAKITYERSDTAGVGAAYTWKGKKTGSGRMEWIEAAPPSLLAAKLEFKAPMATTNRVEFKLAPQAAGTQVTWVMSGPMPFVSKLMSVFASIDKMVGPDFEAGLANLKALAEKP
jgi:carbon monoxide dehydrogenase subunit G